MNLPDTLLDAIAKRHAAARVHTASLKAIAQIEEQRRVNLDKGILSSYGLEQDAREAARRLDLECAQAAESEAVYAFLANQTHLSDVRFGRLARAVLSALGVTS